MKKTFLLISIFLSFSLFAELALVVVDMQPYWMDRGVMIPSNSDVKKINELLNHQSRMIEQAKLHQLPILIVEFSSFGETVPSLSSHLTDYDKTKVIQKTTDGLFDLDNKTRQEALEILADWKVDELIIIGANGGSCVESTIIGAIDNNYKVRAYPQAIADFNYPSILYPYHWDMSQDKEEKNLSRYFESENYQEAEDFFDIFDSE